MDISDTKILDSPTYSEISIQGSYNKTFLLMLFCPIDNFFSESLQEGSRFCQEKFVLFSEKKSQTPIIVEVRLLIRSAYKPPESCG